MRQGIEMMILFSVLIFTSVVVAAVFIFSAVMEMMD